MPERLSYKNDRILEFRTLSDAGLLSEGANFKNGVLKVTPEQLETIRTRYAREMGGATVGSLRLHEASVAALDYLPTDTAIENHATVIARLKDITSRYEDALKSRFPSKIGAFKKNATVEVETKRLVEDKSVTYRSVFESHYQESERGRKIAVPKSLQVTHNRYGGPTTERAASDRQYPHDELTVAYDARGEIEGMNLLTRAVSPGRSADVSQEIMKHTEVGIAANIINIVDEDAIPLRRIYDHNKVDTTYSAVIRLRDDELAVRLSRTVYQMGTVGLGYYDDGSLHYIASESTRYVFSPEKNCFVKTRGNGKEWIMGPDEIETGRFIAIVEEALSNVPTIGGEALVSI